MVDLISHRWIQITQRIIRDTRQMNDRVKATQVLSDNVPDV
jgi:hypothetical protein